ncbi:MAG: flagellar protein FlbB [Treponema sp.]|nr:flagellar protein FlbB [Treponema sp.]
MIGRTIVLLLLIAILSVGGLIWFDFLNVIDAKSVLAPLYKHLPFIPGEGRTQPAIGDDDLINLDAERLAIMQEAIMLREMELDTRQSEIDSRNDDIQRMAAVLQDRQDQLDDRENTITSQRNEADNKDRIVEQQARYLTGMPPQAAVGILNVLDDQLAIDVLRKTEDIARAEGTASVVAFWFSLMEPARAAELQRKMAGRPSSL